MQTAETTATMIIAIAQDLVFPVPKTDNANPVNIAQYAVSFSTTILPSFFQVSNGNLVEGTVDNLHESDDVG